MVIEVALALVLLVGAGLMTRSFTKLLQVNPGFDPTNVVAARVLLPATKYQRATQVRFYEDVIERMRRAPGVTNASAVVKNPGANTTNLLVYMGFIGGGQPGNNPPTANFTVSCNAQHRCTLNGRYTAISTISSHNSMN